eukprot:2501785-Pyramimonas_sp.AAC.1
MTKAARHLVVAHDAHGLDVVDDDVDGAGGALRGGHEQQTRDDNHQKERHQVQQRVAGALVAVADVAEVAVLKRGNKGGNMGIY